MTNSCEAVATAKATYAKAQAAVSAVTSKTGGQANAFNGVFGISTDFAAITSVDDQGNVIASTGSGSAAASSSTSGGKFTGNLGGVTAPPVTDLVNGQFQVTHGSRIYTFSW